MLGSLTCTRLPRRSASVPRDALLRVEPPTCAAEEEQPPTAAALVCVECGARSAEGARWKAEFVTDDELEDDDEIAVYCPACWVREFGWTRE